MKLNKVIYASMSGVVVYLGVATIVGGLSGRGVSSAADPVSPAKAEVSGTRLKAKYTTGSDGSKIYDAEVLFDSQLTVDCKFSLAADGKQRCLPKLGPDAIDGWTVVFYSDPQCTTQAAFLPAPPTGCPVNVPKYVVMKESPGFCPQPDPDTNGHVYAVGAFMGGAQAFTKNGPNCQPAGANNTVPYALGPELPASTFAEGTVGVDP